MVINGFQTVWNLADNDQVFFSNRTCLEETSRAGEPQWSDRLRESFILKFPNAIWQKYTPVIYDETFSIYTNLTG